MVGGLRRFGTVWFFCLVWDKQLVWAVWRVRDFWMERGR